MTTVNIIVTGKGAFPMEGIAKLGTKKSIPVEQFSSVWMEAADKASQAAIDDYIDSLPAPAPAKPEDTAMTLQKVLEAMMAKMEPAADGKQPS